MSLIILIAVGYATYAIADHEGPLRVFDRLREGLLSLANWFESRLWDRPADGVLNIYNLLTCYVCLSFWVALGVLYLVYSELRLIEALAYAGVVVAVRKGWDTLTAALEARNSHWHMEAATRGIRDKKIEEAYKELTMPWYATAKAFAREDKGETGKVAVQHPTNITVSAEMSMQPDTEKVEINNYAF